MYSLQKMFHFYFLDTQINLFSWLISRHIVCIYTVYVKLVSEEFDQYHLLQVHVICVYTYNAHGMNVSFLHVYIQCTINEFCFLWSSENQFVGRKKIGQN